MRQLVHRLLWHRIPQSIRRALLMWITQKVAPRPTSAPEISDRIVVAGYLRACSGLGEAARLCYEALRQSGNAVTGIDLSKAMMQDENRVDFDFLDASQTIGSGTIILHVNAPWVPFALFLLGRRLVRSKRIVGYWHWELPEIPSEWCVGSRFVHEIWVPSRFTAEAVKSKITDKPVRIIPHPVGLRIPMKPPYSRRPEFPFVVLVVFNMSSSLTRKNPFAAIAAFKAAFGTDPHARLIIKTTTPEAYRQGFSKLLAATESAQNVEVIMGALSPEEMDALYNSADVVVSLHRSEGFGLVIAEAMLRGIPVLATDWSGSTDFLNTSNGIPVNWLPISAVDQQGEYHRPHLTWADPDTNDAAAKLKALRDDPDLRKKLGERARLDVAHLFSVERYSAAVATALNLCRQHP
jgi:glycosyltransferase involved in cell wall biosynthesis